MCGGRGYFGSVGVCGWMAACCITGVALSGMVIVVRGLGLKEMHRLVVDVTSLMRYDGGFKEIWVYI